VRCWGGIAAGRWRLPDDQAHIQTAARAAASCADVIIVIGGASVGEHDFAKQALAPLGLEMIFSKVAIKPGKPVWFGRAAGAFVIGLPGNPTSALVTARLFLAPLLAGLSGRNTAGALDWHMMPVITTVGAHSERDQFIRAVVTPEGAAPLHDQDSAGQKALADATLLIWHGRGQPPAAANTRVRTLLF
jgi:molybdopterin molybdotransferase